jgi:hypothetical protein
MIHATIANKMHPLAVTRAGAEVYVNLIQSPAARHIGQQPHILGLAVRLLQNAKLVGEEIALEYDFGHPIGNTDIVETTAKDTIIYAKQLKQNTFTRFVKRRSLTNSSNLTLYLHRDSEGNYELHDVRIGHPTPPQPGSDNETTDSKSFWENHAVVLEGQPLQMSTLTKVSPF